MLARRRRRAGVPLAEAGITLKTRLRYFAGLQRILKLIQLAHSWADLDDRIAGWIELQWEVGESIGLISDSLCGLTFYLPAARHQVPECWRLFRTWRKAEIPNRAPPMPAEILWGFTGYCLSHNWLRMACVLATAFHCMLRTGEALSIAPGDFLLRQGHGILKLHQTKTGRSWDEYIRIEDARVLAILASLLPLLGSDEPTKPVWRGSGQLFRSSLQHIVAHFAVEHLQLRGYSLRRGGATDDFERFGSLERTLQRGRWQSSRVARLYLADGAARLTHLRLNTVQLARIRQYAALCTL